MKVLLVRVDLLLVNILLLVHMDSLDLLLLGVVLLFLAIIVLLLLGSDAIENSKRDVTS